MSTSEGMSEGLVGGTCCLGKVEVNMEAYVRRVMLNATAQKCSGTDALYVQYMYSTS